VDNEGTTFFQKMLATTICGVTLKKDSPLDGDRGLEPRFVAAGRIEASERIFGIV
jgi:hypothetical protein